MPVGKYSFVLTLKKHITHACCEFAYTKRKHDEKKKRNTKIAPVEWCRRGYFMHIDLCCYSVSFALWFRASNMYVLNCSNEMTWHTHAMPMKCAISILLAFVTHIIAYSVRSWSVSKLCFCWTQPQLIIQSIQCSLSFFKYECNKNNEVAVISGDMQTIKNFFYTRLSHLQWVFLSSSICLNYASPSLFAVSQGEGGTDKKKCNEFTVETCESTLLYRNGNLIDTEEGTALLVAKLHLGTWNMNLKKTHFLRCRFQCFKNIQFYLSLYFNRLISFCAYKF